MALEIQKGEGEFSHAPMNPSSPLPSPGPSPTVSSTAPALILSNSGKIMDQSGMKKKYVKQVTGRHNLMELHLAAQRGDLAAVRLIPSEIDAQMTRSAGGEEFDAEVVEIRSAVVNEVNEVEETLLIIAAERGFLDVVVELLKYSDRESVSRKNKSEYDALHSAARGGHIVKSVRNLNGHSIGPCQIHAGKSVPIVKGGKQTKMDEDKFFTIETFASTGYVVVEAELQGADFWRQGYS